MAQNLSTEDRLVILEGKMTESERQRSMQENRDVALLARVDNLSDDLKRMERVQLRGFDELRTGQNDLRAVQHAQEEYLTARINDVEGHLTARLDTVDNQLGHLTARLDTVEDHLTALTEAVVSHKEIIEAIHAGQKALQAGLLTLQAGLQALQAEQRVLQAGQQQIFEILAGRPRFRLHD